jgi:hypothetical protein
MTSDVLVMGGGATGQLAAAYLRKCIPNLKVAVIESRHENRPIVGESLVEVSVDFMLRLGLGAYLVEKHYRKYGLTYYFKPDIDNPADRTYVVDEIPTAPQILSFQINRFTFDREVRDRNVENGVELIDGTVTKVDINGSAGCRFADGERFRYFSSPSLSLSSTGPAPEATPPRRRCQDRFYRQTFSKVGSGPSHFREAHRFVVERDREPSAPRGFAAEKKAWLGGPHSTATRFISNIASIACSRKNSSRPTNFSFP